MAKHKKPVKKSKPSKVEMKVEKISLIDCIKNNPMKVVSLTLLTLSFAGLFLVMPGTWIYYICVAGILMTIWLDFFIGCFESHEIDQAFTPIMGVVDDVPALRKTIAT